MSIVSPKTNAERENILSNINKSLVLIPPDTLIVCLDQASRVIMSLKDQVSGDLGMHRSGY